jgi:ribosome biogenesis protein BMS1
VSGIRGQIKKPLSKPHPEGSFRATFEDKLLLSDIVFLRTWYPLSPITYFNPVASHSLPFKAVWFGAKSIGQLRYEQNLPTPFNPDSVYKPIERVERQFNPLQIPKQGDKKRQGLLFSNFFLKKKCAQLLRPCPLKRRCELLLLSAIE